MNAPGPILIHPRKFSLPGAVSHIVRFVGVRRRYSLLGFLSIILIGNALKGYDCTILSGARLSEAVHNGNYGTAQSAADRPGGKGPQP
jgi:hypothetical protein